MSPIRASPFKLTATVLVVATLGLLLAACSTPGYANENASLAEAVLNLPSVTAVGEADNTTYCKQDTCWLGDDGVTTSYDVEVSAEVDMVRQQLTEAQPTWQITIIEGCEDPVADCGADNLIYITGDRDGLLQLSFDDNGIGQLTAEAESGSTQTYN